MAIFAVGISYHNAPVDIREQFAFQEDDLPRALQSICTLPEINESVIINTCNRVEIYVSTSSEEPEKNDDIAYQLLLWLHQWHSVKPSYVDRFRRYFDKQAVTHLMQVSAGLDSLVLGEPQIGGQVKHAHAVAYQAAEHGDASPLGSLLDRLFQQAFSCAKTVRTDTQLGRHPVTVPYAVLNLARQIFSDLHACKVLLVGAGEMIQLSAHHFANFPVNKVMIANRSIAGAQRIKNALNEDTRVESTVAIEALGLEQLPDYLHEADIVITSTASQTALIDKAMVRQALKARRHQPMLMVDIAVPRDIHPAVGKLADVYMYTIDDLTTVLDGNRQLRAAAAAEAEQIIAHQTELFDQWVNLRKGSVMLQRFRNQADTYTQELLQQAQQQLSNGHTPTAVVERLAHQLSRRLLHLPTTRLREAIKLGEFERAQQMQALFLDDHTLQSAQTTDDDDTDSTAIDHSGD